MLAHMVYALCGVTSTFCASLLYLKYKKRHTRLLLWSSICFIGLALNNILLFIDMVVVPEINLSVVRTVPAFLGLSALLFSFIWDVT